MTMRGLSSVASVAALVVGSLPGLVAAVANADAESDRHPRRAAESSTAKLEPPTANPESPAANPESPAAKLESILWSALANSGMSFTSIESVECDEFDCEIRFTGGHDQQELLRTIFAAGWDRTRDRWPVFKMGSVGQNPLNSGQYVLTVSTRCPSPDGCPD